MGNLSTGAEGSASEDACRVNNIESDQGEGEGLDLYRYGPERLCDNAPEDPKIARPSQPHRGYIPAAKRCIATSTAFLFFL